MKTKRDHIRNYFPVSNEIFTLGLSSGAIAVYAYLMYCEDRTTYQCYPSYETIGKSIGMSRNTVMKYVRELERTHLIKTESTTVTTQNGVHRNGNLLYTILPIQDIVKEHFERQLRLAEQQKQLAEYEKRANRR